jgi:hypothetical protein
MVRDRVDSCRDWLLTAYVSAKHWRTVLRTCIPWGQTHTNNTFIGMPSCRLSLLGLKIDCVALYGLLTSVTSLLMMQSKCFKAETEKLVICQHESCILGRSDFGKMPILLQRRDSEWCGRNTQPWSPTRRTQIKSQFKTCTFSQLRIGPLCSALQR